MIPELPLRRRRVPRAIVAAFAAGTAAVDSPADAALAVEVPVALVVPADAVDGRAVVQAAGPVLLVAASSFLVRRPYALHSDGQPASEWGVRVSLFLLCAGQSRRTESTRVAALLRQC